MGVDEPKLVDAAALLEAWGSLIERYSASPVTNEVGRELLACWSEPHRGYHNVCHLQEILRHVDELAAHAIDLDAVRLAAWYHDIVYAGLPDDEQNSAAQAKRELTELHVAPTLVNEVVRLIRLTASHKPAAGDSNGETLCDADLAILAATPERYAEYTAAVRAEYAHVSDEAFNLGRSKILRSLLNGPVLYRTPVAYAKWEAIAHSNLSAELDRLERSE